MRPPKGFALQEVFQVRLDLGLQKGGLLGIEKIADENNQRGLGLFDLVFLRNARKVFHAGRHSFFSQGTNDIAKVIMKSFVVDIGTDQRIHQNEFSTGELTLLGCAGPLKESIAQTTVQNNGQKHLRLFMKEAFLDTE